MSPRTPLACFALLFLWPVLAMAGPRTCPICTRAMEHGWNFCPFDGSSLPRQCASCGKMMEEPWGFCPFDGTLLVQVSAPAGAAPPAAEVTPVEPEAPIIVADGPPETLATKPPAAEAEATEHPLNDPISAMESYLLALRDDNRSRLDDIVLWRVAFADRFAAPDANPEEVKKAILRDEKKRLDALASQYDMASLRVESFRMHGNEADLDVTIPLAKGKKGPESARLHFELRIERSLWRISGVR